MQGLRALCSAACRKQSGSRQTHDGTEQDSERCCQVHVVHPQLGRLAAGKAARQKVPWHSRGCDVFLVAGYQLGEGKCSAWRDLHTLGDTRLGSSQEPIIALGLGRKGMVGHTSFCSPCIAAPVLGGHGMRARVCSVQGTGTDGRDINDTISLL